MSNQPYYPKREGDQLTWLTNLQTKLPDHYTALGIGGDRQQKLSLTLSWLIWTWGNCYAEALAKRVSTLGGWGPGAPRRRTSADYWKAPLKWNRDAELARLNYERGVDAGAPMWRPARPRVFCASLADWLDDEVPIEWLRDLLVLIQETPELDWLLLTKRPQNFAARIAAVADGWQSSCELAVWWTRGIEPSNVWIGTTVEDQTRAELRIPQLLQIPAKVRFLSCEPLLGPLDLSCWLTGWAAKGSGLPSPLSEALESFPDIPGIDWVICGGESGPKARPMQPDWARGLRDQCAAAGVPFLFKQQGEYGVYFDIGTGTVSEAFDPDIRRKIREGEVWGSPVEQLAKVGKKRAGRFLDGAEHNAFPSPRP